MSNGETGVKDYARVIVVWLFVLAALLGLQAYFS
jgi:hypothetical protein